MLKLLRLEVSGFKSFVDPVTVDFAGGVTSVVGPNGCGKSNLSEAITWVLGEQSAKTLRGDTMEDVIFNGTEQRRPLGMAEVTVSFACDPSFDRGDQGRLVIARRVFRSGESQYRLNGRVVRLKEIKDLLMDTGLGIRAYSVIEQGKIGMILSGKPQERRKLIEEAAGVTRYKARKKVAEVKLEEASGNLLRLDDILAEVERNLRALKRQASAARRFQERQVEYRERLRLLLLGRHARSSAQLAARRAELGAAQEAEASLIAAIHREESELAAHRERVEKMAETLAESSRRQAELAGTIEGRQEFLRGAKRTIEELRARRAGGEALAVRRRQDGESHRQRLGELAAERGELELRHLEAAAAVADDDRALAAAREAATLAERRMEAIRQELLTSLGSLNAIRSQLHREQIENEKVELRGKHLEDERALRSRDLAEAQGQVQEAESRIAGLERRLAELDLAVERGESELEETLAREGEAAQRLRVLETEQATRGERQRFLSELGEAQEAGRHGLAERLRAAGLADPVFLGERLHAHRRGWEGTLDLYLGDLVDAAILPPGTDGLDTAARLAGTGRAATLLQPSGETHDDPANLADSGIVAPLHAALGLPEALARALPPAFLVDTPETAVRLAAAHPGTTFLTRDHLCAEGGLIRLLGEAVQPGILAREAELVDLDQELARLEAELGATRSGLDDLLATRSRAAQALGQKRDEIAHLRQELAVTRARREEAATRVRRAEASLAAVAEESQTLAGEREKLAERQRLLAIDLAGAEDSHGAREQAFDRVQAELAHARASRESQSSAGAGRRGELDVLAERLRSLDREGERLQRELAGAEQHLAAWAHEAAELAERQEELESAMARAESELADAFERATTVGDELRAEQEALESERDAVRSRDQALTTRRALHEGQRSAVEERRVALVGLEHDLVHLASDFEQEFREPLPEVPAEIPENLDEIEDDVARLRGALEAIGPVNVLAATEYTEQEERHGFLSAQRADVVKSVESLRQTIREINETSSARFKEAFDEVNRHFSETFVDLFRGGEAEMRLMDEDDLLECGIEIVARPPGKRLQNMMLLSGGEKALTAIALLFALFRTKPSPFCILDEVDAPLDDVNTLRYVHMLRNLAKTTQCIVITHNKLTMEVASTLYGVTMEERGVSKLVAVRLEEVQPGEPQEEEAVSA